MEEKPKIPNIARPFPYRIKVEKDKKYLWCSCGESKKQPFCDGAHKKDGIFEPIEYVAKETKTIKFCGCKYSGTRPICDQTHVEYLIQRYGYKFYNHPILIYSLFMIPFFVFKHVVIDKKRIL